jgi:peptidoglycan/LPS O-acetylase OafA/YrhL
MQHSPALIPGRDYVKSLDGVRGLAILIVLIHNASWIMHSSEALATKLTLAITSTWWIGVSLFFVLSGVLITGILLDTRQSPSYFRSFYVRRALRIFPLYYAVLAVVFWVGPHLIASATWRQSVHDHQIWYWLHLQNWQLRGISGLPHFWSLAVEEQFYLFWPLVVWLLPVRRLLAFSLLIVATMPLVRLELWHSGLPQGPTYAYAVARWDALALGAVVAILLRDEGWRTWIRSHAPTIGWSALAALVGFVAVHRGFHSGDLLVDVLGQSIVGVLFASLIGTTLLSEGWLGERLERVFCSRWLSFLGKYSYAIYVFHVPLHHLAERHVARWVNAGSPLQSLGKLLVYDALVLLSSTLLALISWNVLEKRCLQLRDRWAPRSDRSPPATHTDASTLRAA